MCFMLEEILQTSAKIRPPIGWVTTYQRVAAGDLVSGVVVGAIMVPVAMAYAQMAGVDPQQGLYSAILGMIVYAVFATSRHLKITTSSTMSIMSIAVVAPLVASGFGTYLALSSALAITVGIIMLILSFMKLGFISDFLSKSVMTGYIFGVALLIAMSQLPKVFGFRAAAHVLSTAGTVHRQPAPDQPVCAGPGRRHDRLDPGDQTLQAADSRRAAGVDSGNRDRRIFSTQHHAECQRRRGHPDRYAEPDAPDHQPAGDTVSHRGRGIVFRRSVKRWEPGGLLPPCPGVNADQRLLAMGAANVGSGLSGHDE
jgi:hypothetical protein